jgi:hypothetical protein
MGADRLGLILQIEDTGGGLAGAKALRANTVPGFLNDVWANVALTHRALAAVHDAHFVLVENPKHQTCYGPVVHFRPPQAESGSGSVLYITDYTSL